MLLEKEELESIHGGAIGTAIVGGLLSIGGFVVFLMGLVDGVLNPKKCGE